MNQQDKDVHDPLSRQAFDSVVYNAVGRASEINTWPAYALSHSTGNSGWSVGIVQWDFGQPGRGHKVEDLLQHYQAWAAVEARFDEPELASLDRRLRLRGQTGNALTEDEKHRLNGFLRSDDGRAFVEGLNREQIDYKWRTVGAPLADIPWLQALGESDPRQATEIVAMACKLFNQNETRGARLRDHLQQNEMTSQGVRDWIGSTGIQGLNPAARSAITSGRDKALAGAKLLNELQYGDSPLAARWQDIVRRGDTGLSLGFEFNSDLQLFDAMLRHPENGARLLTHVADGGATPSLTIRGVNSLARLEMAEVQASPSIGVAISTTRRAEYVLNDAAWSVRHPVPASRPRDAPDYTEGARSVFPSLSNPRAEAIRSKVKSLYEQHHIPIPENELEQVTSSVLRDPVGTDAGEISRLMFPADHRTGLPNPGAGLIAWYGEPRDPATRWSSIRLDESGVAPAGTSPGTLSHDEPILMEAHSGLPRGLRQVS